MAKRFVVHALWDDEAACWIATSEDIPGLCCEAKTFEELIQVIVKLTPELLFLNGIVPEKGLDDIPLNVLAERHALARMTP